MRDALGCRQEAKKRDTRVGSLFFRFASRPLLAVLVIPAIYIVMRDDGRGEEDGPAEAPPPVSAKTA
jgi:hypothetical protein